MGKTEIAVPTKIAYLLANKKEAQELRLWAILRHVSDTSSKISVTEAKGVLTHPESEYYLMKNIDNILKRGDGVFWRITPHGIILLHKPSRIMWEASLGVRAGGRKTYIPLHLFKKLKTIRAAFFGAFLNKHDAPISMNKLKEITGVSISSQKNYRKIIGIKAVPNIGLIYVNGARVSIKHPIVDRLDKKFSYVFTVKRDGFIYPAIRLPNNYKQVFRESYSPRQAKKFCGHSNYQTVNKQSFIKIFRESDQDDGSPTNTYTTFYFDTKADEKEQKNIKKLWHQIRPH